MTSVRPLPLVRAHGWMRVGRAAAITLLPVLALGMGVASALRSETDRWVLSAGRQQAAAMVNMAVLPQLDGRPLSAGLTDAQRAGLLRSTAPLVARGTVYRFRLRTLDGSVVFDAVRPTAGSTAHPVISKGTADDASEMGEAVERNGLVEVTRLNADEIDGGAQDHAVLGQRAIEAYEPLIIGANPPAGVAEIYVPYAPIAGAAEALLHRLSGLAVIGLLFLWGALTLIFTSSNRRAMRSAEHHRHLALHDVLTQLPNRALFRQRADDAVEAARAVESQVAVAIIDIDRFKEINDTLGHHNGDAYLMHAARQLSELIGDRGTVARLGGDEFGIVLPGSTPELLAELGESICMALRTPVELDSVPVSAECSIGIAVWPVHGTEVDALLRNADSAMYAAKQGRLGAVVYNGEMTHFSRSRLTLVSELRRAIRDDELVLFYQPKIRMSSGAVESVEALVRWVHPTRGFLPPSEFLPMAESTGLIDDLSRWVIRTAVAQLAQWESDASAPGAMPAIAINLSARNLRDGSIATYIFETLRSRGIAADRLIVEITETAYLEDPERSSVVLMELREAGVRVSLDDFGQGYTSLGHLGQLPLAELKIDRSFVNFMASDTRHRQIVESVVNLGHELGLCVVAEGVETDDQQSMLAAMGCDTVQGYLHARPQPPEVLVEWLRARVRARSAALTAAGEGEHLLGL